MNVVEVCLWYVIVDYGYLCYCVGLCVDFYCVLLCEWVGIGLVGCCLDVCNYIIFNLDIGCVVGLEVVFLCDENFCVYLYVVYDVVWDCYVCVIDYCNFVFLCVVFEWVMCD